MSDEFKMSDLNKPLYEHSQVITEIELEVILISFLESFEKCKWWQLNAKFQLLIGITLLRELLLWLKQGKPNMIERRKS